MNKTIIWALVLVALSGASYYAINKTQNAEKPGGNNQAEMKYVALLDWPPQTQILNEPFICTEAGSSTERPGETRRRTIEGRKYCITKIVEAAAGSVYTQYAYAFEKSGKTVILTFTVRHPQCANYPEGAERSTCEKEISNFNADKLVPDIADKVDISSAQNPDEQVFCTMEAKLCPDGSYVGRQGPRCEFAPCPGQ